MRNRSVSCFQLANDRAPPLAALRREAQTLDDCVASVLTRKQIVTIFAARHNYDLRRLLTGTEATMASGGFNN